MTPPPPRSTPTEPLFPYTTLFRCREPTGDAPKVCTNARARNLDIFGIEFDQRGIAAQTLGDQPGSAGAAERVQNHIARPTARPDTDFSGKVDRKSTRLNSSHYCPSRMPPYV